MTKVGYDIFKIFNIVKVFAILSVILAHSKIQDGSIFAAIAERVGCIGVVVFYFISGYFFNISKYGAFLFFEKKIITIVIPWLILGSLVFIISSNPKTIYSWFNWIIGNGSYLYYLTVLMMCFITFAISEHKYFLFLMMLVTVVSNIFTSHYSDFFPFTHINPYLNPFNWMGFFAFDIVVNKFFFDFFKYLFKYRILIFFSFLICIYISVLVEDNFGYFSKYGLIVEFMGLLTVFGLATFNVFNFKIIQKISTYTFSIYLIHFLVFPVRKVLILNEYTQFINPIIYLSIAFVLLLIGKFIADKIKMERLYNTVMGLR